jgi:hypothetical protein
VSFAVGIGIRITGILSESNVRRKKQSLDAVAMEYVGKAANDVRHLVPVDVAADGNCLYNSIVLLMDSTVVTASELRGMEIRFLLMGFSSLSKIFSSNGH